MKTPDVSRLPKWAQDYIERISRERDTAVKALKDHLDQTKPSPVFYEDSVCIGGDKPARGRRASGLDPWRMVDGIGASTERTARWYYLNEGTRRERRVSGSHVVFAQRKDLLRLGFLNHATGQP